MRRAIIGLILVLLLSTVASADKWNGQRKIDNAQNVTVTIRDNNGTNGIKVNSDGSINVSGTIGGGSASNYGDTMPSTGVSIGGVDANSGKMVPFFLDPNGALLMNCFVGCPQPPPTTYVRHLTASGATTIANTAGKLIRIVASGGTAGTLVCKDSSDTSGSNVYNHSVPFNVLNEPFGDGIPFFTGLNCNPSTALELNIFYQ